MCFDLGSLPPITPIVGAAVSHTDLTLKSGDGTDFAAFAAKPDNGTSTGVVVLPDVRGLYRYYEELALRLAEQGYPTVAIDYFGRLAGVSKRDEDFPYMEYVPNVKADHVADDVGAAVDYLRSPEGGSCTKLFTVGFCFGGSQSWLQAANRTDLAGAVGFYGRPGPGRDGSPGTADRASEISAPILALMGGADPGIPADQIELLDSALTAAGVEHEVKSYDGAPHSFFDRKYDEFKDECADAWDRVLSFIASHS